MLPATAVVLQGMTAAEFKKLSERPEHTPPTRGALAGSGCRCCCHAAAAWLLLLLPLYCCIHAAAATGMLSLLLLPLPCRCSIHTAIAAAAAGQRGAEDDQLRERSFWSGITNSPPL